MNELQQLTYYAPMRNPLYAPKLNMFLLWLSCSFVFEKRDTKGCKSKSQK